MLGSDLVSIGASPTVCSDGAVACDGCSDSLRAIGLILFSIISSSLTTLASSFDSR